MAHWLKILLLIIAVTHGVNTSCVAGNEYADEEQYLWGNELVDINARNNKYRIHCDYIIPTHTQEALITDNSQLVRLLVSHTERISSNNSDDTFYRKTKNYHTYKLYHYPCKAIKGYMHTIVAPIPPFVATHYYVIALRHIIR